jgi:hypothetical protein
MEKVETGFHADHQPLLPGITERDIGHAFDVQRSKCCEVYDFRPETPGRAVSGERDRHDRLAP